MPRTLAIDPRAPAQYGVLIRRHALDEHARAYCIVNDARSHARRIVKEAQRKANEIEHHAIQQGFNTGWLNSMEALFQALSNAEQLHGQIEDALKKAVRTALEQALQNPALELQLLESWLTATRPENVKLSLIVPRHAQHHISAIKQRVEAVTGHSPLIAIGEDARVVIRSGDQIFEFSPDRSLEELSELARSCLQRLEVRNQCVRWGEMATELWLERLNVSNPGGENNEDAKRGPDNGNFEESDHFDESETSEDSSEFDEFDE